MSYQFYNKFYQVEKKNMQTSILKLLFQQQYDNMPSLQDSCRNSKSLFIIRVICWIYISIIYLWFIIGTPSLVTNVIYLTMQGYFLTWLYFTLVLQDRILNFSPLSKTICQKIKYYTVIINQLAFCFQIPITIVFWSVLFRILLQMQDATTDIIIINCNLHAGPLICLAIDFYYNRFTFKFRRYFVIFAYCTAYVLLNMVYSITYKNIYKPVDWVSVLSYVLIVVTYLMTFGTHCFGRWYYNKYKKHLLGDKNPNLRHIRQNLISQAQQQQLSNNHKKAQTEDTPNFKDEKL